MKYFLLCLAVYLASYSQAVAQTSCPTVPNPVQHLCGWNYPEYAKIKLLTATDTGGGIAWYPDNSSMTPLNPEDLLVDGQVYYAGATDGSCVGSRPAVTVELYDTPIAGSTTFLEFDSNDPAVDILPLLKVTPVGPGQDGGTMVPAFDSGETIFNPSSDANFTGRKQYKHWVYSKNDYCGDDYTVVYITVHPQPNTSHRLYYLGINEADAEQYLEYYPPSSSDEGLEVNIWLDVPLEVGSVYKMTVSGQERYYYVNNVYATPDTSPNLTLTSDTPMEKLSWDLEPGDPEAEVPGLEFPEYGLYTGPSFSNENYIYTRAPQIAVSSMDSITTTDEVVEQISYFDGLGRPLQSVAIRGGGGQEDLITPVTYDEFGRQTKEYLPYAAQSQNGQLFPSALTQVQDFYNVAEFGNTTNPYSESELENSPLNRLQKQAAPGGDWALGIGNEIEFGHSTNVAQEVRLYEVAFTSGDTEAPNLVLATEEYYLPGTLYKNITRDENHSGTTKNHTTEEFTDKQGRVVLKRTYADTDQLAQDPHDTYYVYDAYGNLTYVLPPKMEGSTAALTQILTDLSKLGYQYTYDHRNRLVEKQLPGKVEEYIIYNGLDQPILTQDANLRLEHKWLYTKYDAFGRVTGTGIYTDTQSLGRESMQQQLTTFYAGSTPPRMYEEKAGSVYTNQAFPIAGTELLTENFYDNYNFNKGTITVPGTSVYGKPLTTAVKGLATGTRIKVLGEPHWITTISGYDDKGRAIWSASENTFLGTKDEVNSQLDFVGKVRQQTEAHTRDTLEITVENFYTYDHIGRQLLHTQKINGGEEELIAHNTYDALGQLVQKRVGGEIEADMTTTQVPTTFTDLVGVTAGTDGSFTKNIATNAWGDSGLATENSFSGDGYVEYVVPQTDKSFMTGISQSNANAHYNTINFAFYTRNDAKLFVYQNGSNKSGSNGLGTYEAGDTLRVERVGSSVYYKQNGNILYAVATTVTGEMIGDVALHTTGATLINLNLVQKSSGGFQPLQTIDYAYNIRGWLKTINNPTDLGEDLFGFEISYNDPRSGATPLYNGNISETHWNTLSENNTQNPVSNQYLYSYDPLNRITAAIDNTRNYDLKQMSYDKNGNIMALARNGFQDTAIFEDMDNLGYLYDGNQLMKVTDSGSRMYGFVEPDPIAGQDDYAYDDNGNLISDANKGIPTNGIIYNYLNLPTSITLPGGTIIYDYDATGVKLRKKVIESGQLNKYTFYASNYVYERAGDSGLGTMNFFNHPEGYLELNETGGFDYVYQYKDHLGNIRLSYSDLDLNGLINPNTEILDEKNYYPFGGEHKGYNSNVNSTYHPYGYNGKEEQDELGLEWLDYGARNYDKWLVRYFNVDRMSEAYYDLNPYQYTANNPVKFIDVNGDYIYIWENGTQYRYENGVIQKQNEKGKWIKHIAQEDSYVSQIAGALGDITGGDPNSFGSQFLGLFENDDVNVSLFENTSQGKNTKGRNITQGTNIYTFFNQSGSIRTTGGSEKLSENFHITLGHELAHGLGNNLLSQGALNDTWVSNVQTSDGSKNIKNSEIFASMYENMLRSEQGLELRTHYIGGTSDNRSRLIQKSKTKNPFSKVYNPTQATLEIFSNLVRRPKMNPVISIKPAGHR